MASESPSPESRSTESGVWKTRSMENTEYGKHGVWKTRCAWSCSIFRFILMKMKLALRMWLTNTFSFFCAILELPEFIISQENFRSKRLKLRAWRPVLGYWAFIFSVRNEQKMCYSRISQYIFYADIFWEYKFRTEDYLF